MATCYEASARRAGARRVAAALSCALALCHAGAARAEDAEPVYPKGVWHPGLAQRGLGVGPVVGSVKAANGTRSHAGVAASVHGIFDAQLDQINTRHRDLGELGLDDHGLLGELALDLAFGYRAAITSDSGPVVRGGVRAQLAKRDDAYASLLEAPQLQAGYQWLTSTFKVELTARTGIAIFRRLHAAGLRADADARADLGALFDLWIWLLRFEASGSAFPSGTDTHYVGSASACATPWHGWDLCALSSAHAARDPAARPLRWLSLELRVAFSDSHRR